MHDTVDVIVTDGFTGNVALKTVEGAIRGTAKLVFDTAHVHARAAGGVGSADARRCSKPPTRSTPTTRVDASLLGVDGICVIAHGSSNARAMKNSVRRAKECVEAGVVDRMKGAVADAG